MAETHATIPSVPNQPIHCVGNLALTPELRFEEAADRWMESRVVQSRASSQWSPRYIKPHTESDYRCDLKTLKLFFTGTRLCDIRLDHLRTYQAKRIEGREPFIRSRRPHEEPKVSPVKASRVNKETILLVRIMKRAKAWDPALDDYFEPLQVEQTETPRALSWDDEKLWLEVSLSNQRWWLVHWYSILALSTCMGTNEIRGLRLGDINLEARVLTVPVEGAKNKYRHRTIKLTTPEVHWALERLIERTRSLGSFEPTHYLFPIMAAKGQYNPMFPMNVSGMNKRWEEVRIATGLKAFRQYDCRHTAITRMAEAGVPVSVIMSFAGHISPHMTRHYTHISRNNRRTSPWNKPRAIGPSAQAKNPLGHPSGHLLCLPLRLYRRTPCRHCSRLRSSAR